MALAILSSRGIRLRWSLFSHVRRVVVTGRRFALSGFLSGMCVCAVLPFPCLEGVLLISC